MVLNLIAGGAGSNGRAGPLVIRHGSATPLRDWLCDALMPMSREPRRLALAQRVREELGAAGQLPGEAALADARIEDEVKARLRASGKTNVSRAVSDLVRGGLLMRHYQGYRVDHHNRGAQRQAVYTLSPDARRLLVAGDNGPPPMPRQASLGLGR